ncbi:MAG: hypothetical protein RRZ24_02050 [Clostridia bacterium]
MEQKHRYRSVISGTGGRWATSALLAALCMLLTFALYRTTFLNNDDTNIMYAIAGYRTGQPFPTHRFINVALGWLIYRLYGALPAIPWWAVYQIAMLWLSTTVIFSSIRKICQRAKIEDWVAVVALVLLYGTMLVYTVAWVAFTLTAAMLGTAAMSLVFALDWETDARATQWWTAAGSLVLLVLCFFTRNSSGYSMLCFVGAAVFYQFLKTRGRRRAAVCCYAAVAGGLVAGAVLLNHVGIVRLNAPNYVSFEEARGEFIDFPHITYEDDPAFFAKIGWDKTIYDLADNRCYIDECINADTMMAVVSAQLQQQPGVGARLTDALNYGIKYFRGSGVSQYMLVVPVLLLLLATWIFLRGKKGGTELLVCCAVAAGSFILCFYLCVIGRFPVRTFMLIAIPAAVAEALLTAQLYRLDEKGCVLEKRIFRAVRVVLYSVGGMMLLWSIIMTQRALLAYDKSEQVEQNAAAEQYVIAHSENLYITDVTSLENIALFTVYPDENERPVNLVDWGGTGMYSGWKQKQLQTNGLERLSGEIFRGDNVYFVTAASSDRLDILYAYLVKHMGATGYDRTDLITGDIGVYHFLFAEKEMDQ